VEVGAPVSTVGISITLLVLVEDGGGDPSENDMVNVALPVKVSLTKESTVAERMFVPVGIAIVSVIEGIEMVMVLCGVADGSTLEGVCTDILLLVAV